jgi:ferredoxin
MRAAEKAGIKRVTDEMGCPLVEFDKPILAPKGGRKFSKQLEIDRAVLEADVVINLPKWKTHGMTVLTLGVKNLFGCIPGAKKALWHLKAGEDRKVFAQTLVDLYQVIQPSLTILDGIIGMEGNGPNSGHPISLGLILASTDPLSLDQIVCDLLGIPRDSLPTNRVAFEEGLAKDGVEVVGERVEEVRIPRFRLPTLSEPAWNLPGFLRKPLKNALTSKPVFGEELCDNCGQCIGTCPPKALEGKGRGLVFDYGKCIRCFCCQEVCPTGAITIKPGWAVKLASRNT